MTDIRLLYDEIRIMERIYRMQTFVLKVKDKIGMYSIILCTVPNAPT